MALDMNLHSLLGRKGLAADRALVHFLPIVRHLVKLQHMVVAERLAANVARVRFLSCVGACVYLQLFRAGETLSARCAHIGFLARVRPHVDDELSALDERL